MDSAPPTPTPATVPAEERVLAALTRMGRRLDELETRKSDADLGHAFKAGRGLFVPLASVVVAFFSAFFMVEARATSVARSQIDSGPTRQMIADQIHAQVDPLAQAVARREDVVALQAQVAALKEALDVQGALRQIEARLPPSRRTRPDAETATNDTSAP